MCNRHRYIPFPSGSGYNSRVNRIAVVACISCLVFVASAAAQGRPRKGDFEGVYSVGTTECVVSAVQMAFEVRWPGGAEPEYYIYDNAQSTDTRVVFASDPANHNGKETKFVFDSWNVTSGIFVASDGSKLPVRKIGYLPGNLP